MTNSLLIQFGALVVLVLFVGVGVRKAAEDGFFPTLCTMAILYAAFRVANLQWEAVYRYLDGNLEMDTASAVSAAYWMGFFMVILPGMLYGRLLTRENVPFPPQVERWGGMAAGAACGLILFGVVVHSVSRFTFYQDHLQTPLRLFTRVLDLMVIV